MDWRCGLQEKKALLGALSFGAAGAGIFIFSGYDRPLSFICAGASFAIIFGLILLYLIFRIRQKSFPVGAALIHIGLALVVLGISISGPYKEEKEVVLSKGETIEIGSFVLEAKETIDLQALGYHAKEARLEVKKNDQPYGILKPELRSYHKFARAHEVSTIFSLGEELYATLLAVTKDGIMSLKVSVNPLVNWFWIGGTIMCLAAFLCLGRRRQ